MNFSKGGYENISASRFIVAKLPFPTILEGSFDFENILCMFAFVQLRITSLIR